MWWSSTWMELSLKGNISLFVCQLCCLTICFKSVPVFAVWLQARDQVTCHWFHTDGLVIQGDDIGGDLRTITVRLLPLKEEASWWGVTHLRGGWEVKEGEGWDLVGICCWRPETHLVTVWTSARLIHRLSVTQKHRECEKDGGEGLWLKMVGWKNLRTEKRDEKKKMSRYEDRDK